MQKINLKRLKKQLNDAHLRFLKSNEVSYDALAPALVYQDPLDKEFAAFICAILAYGRITHIQNSIRRVLGPLGDQPVRRLCELNDKDILRITNNWKHRFNTSRDLYLMLKLLREVYRNYGSLQGFLQINETQTPQIVFKNLHSSFSAQLENWNLPASKSFWFFVPNPEQGSACKRLNLFLKWMVRDEAPDLGLWKSFSKKNLVIPLDTHVHRQARALKITRRSTADWITAEEVTRFLAQLDPEDPTRYDFALCHLGIRGISVGER